MNLELILKAYNINIANAIVIPYGEGLINKTFKVTHQNEDFILQKVNESVFKNPFYIDDNINLIEDYLKANHADYLFVNPIKNFDEKTMTFIGKEGYFRLLPFIKNSITKQVVTNADEAFEAAKQFGNFTSLFNDFKVENLKETIPQFHDLNYRFLQFCDAIVTANDSRINIAKTEIKYLLEHEKILLQFNDLVSKNYLIQRVTHHDTKISNVLFDQSNKAIAVIDLDTVMSGFFISDVGDMMRTYLSPLNEEVTNFNDIYIRKDILLAIKEGYLFCMNKHLNANEVDSFNFSGAYIIYMQALRFLTDFLNNDIYYKITYDLHNYNRAKNQITLLQRFLEII